VKKLILCISVLSLVSSHAYAGRVVLGQELSSDAEESVSNENIDQTTTPTGVRADVVPSYQMPTGVTERDKETIQSAAKKSASSTNIGQALGFVAMGVTGTGVVLNCFGPPYANCGWWIAGLAASTFVTMSMGKAKDQSNRTIAAVTGADGGTAGRGADVIPSYNDSPEMKKANDLLNKVKGLGYKVDMKSGNVTDPKGKVYNASMLGNASAMQAAGHSPSSFAGANSVKKAIDSAVKSAAADGSSMFGDTVGGAGGAAAAKGVEGGGLPGGMTAGFQNPSLGEDRGPAQVAGLAKNLDGTPIGISQDNLFTMIGKRYQWCSTKGCFLPTANP
jgi:hypothetical protein